MPPAIDPIFVIGMVGVGLVGGCCLCPCMYALCVSHRSPRRIVPQSVPRAPPCRIPNYEIKEGKHFHRVLDPTDEVRIAFPPHSLPFLTSS